MEDLQRKLQMMESIQLLIAGVLCHDSLRNTQFDFKYIFC